MTTTKKIDYLNKVQRNLEALRVAMFKMNEIWLQDSDNEIDLNSILAKDYPFDESFDDMVLLIKKWNERVQPLLMDEIKILNGFNEDMVRTRRGEVDEVKNNPEKYKAPEEAQMQSQNIEKVYTEIGGGGELFDFITLKNGQVICIGNDLIGVYRNFDDFETGLRDPQALVPLTK